MVIWDRLDAIRDQASYLLAGSKAGVAFQIMQANVHLDVLVQEDEREQRRIEAQMIRLLYRATDWLVTTACQRPSNSAWANTSTRI